MTEHVKDTEGNTLLMVPNRATRRAKDKALGKAISRHRISVERRRQRLQTALAKQAARAARNAKAAE